MSLVVTVDSQPLKTVLDRLYAVTNDMSPIMSAFGMEMESRISGRFETETDPIGVDWLPWADSTRKSYPKDGNGSILDRHGTAGMLGSLNHAFDSQNATVGFGDPKAQYHEWGTKHMPRRGMLFADPDAHTIAPDDEASLLDIAVRFFEGGFD